jgi:uroporphyrin-III C-methyltransferase/precorrin-2 dehydrogenase/sirohydrochlorin ferrochelatase
MQSFPIFLSLNGRRALVVGGSDAATRKIELLLAAGARVVLVAETVGGEIAEWIEDGAISWSGGTFDALDLADTALVFVASGDNALDALVSAAAQRAGVPVNVVDRPQLSTFIMPSIVDRAPVTIAISTGGTAPSLARLLRAEIDRALPATVGRLARFAESFRDQVKRTLAHPRARRLFWDRVFEGRIGQMALSGDETGARREFIRLLDGARNGTADAGVVHLIDASAGDPELLTLRDHRLLQTADVSVHDRGVAPQVLAMARRDARRICAEAAEADKRVDAFSREGKSVVRLVFRAATANRTRG